MLASRRRHQWELWRSRRERSGTHCSLLPCCAAQEVGAFRSGCCTQVCGAVWRSSYLRQSASGAEPNPAGGLPCSPAAESRCALPNLTPRMPTCSRTQPASPLALLIPSPPPPLAATFAHWRPAHCGCSQPHPLARHPPLCSHAGGARAQLDRGGCGGVAGGRAVAAGSCGGCLQGECRGGRGCVGAIYKAPGLGMAGTGQLALLPARQSWPRSPRHRRHPSATAPRACTAHPLASVCKPPSRPRAALRSGRSGGAER